MTLLDSHDTTRFASVALSAAHQRGHRAAAHVGRGADDLCRRRSASVAPSAAFSDLGRWPFPWDETLGPPAGHLRRAGCGACPSAAPGVRPALRCRRARLDGVRARDRRRADAGVRRQRSGLSLAACAADLALIAPPPCCTPMPVTRMRQADDSAPRFAADGTVTPPATARRSPSGTSAEQTRAAPCAGLAAAGWREHQVARPPGGGIRHTGRHVRCRCRHARGGRQG